MNTAEPTLRDNTIANLVFAVKHALRVGEAWKHDANPHDDLERGDTAEYDAACDFCERMELALSQYQVVKNQWEYEDVSYTKLDILEVVTERDDAEQWADKLAESIAAYFKQDIGEHSNQNNPWARALELIKD